MGTPIIGRPTALLLLIGLLSFGGTGGEVAGEGLVGALRVEVAASGCQKSSVVQI